MENQKKQSAEERVSNVNNIYSRYLAHGNSEMPVVVQAVDRSDKQTPPAVVLLEIENRAVTAPHLNQGNNSHICAIAGIRTDYSGTVAEALSTSDRMKAYLLIHEDTHCRANPRIGASIAGHSDNEGTYASLVNESVADAMGVAMIAHKDGAAAGREVADTLLKVRGKNADKHFDHDHDTREAVTAIKEMLQTDPHKFSTDAGAFAAAIEAGIAGANKRRPDATKDEREGVKTVLDKALETYRNGPIKGREVSVLADDPTNLSRILRSENQPAQIGAAIGGIKNRYQHQHDDTHQHQHENEQEAGDRLKPR